ncbi:MAG TPA: RagB/SusD family nutrient uptake outer membrane protein [Phnomibacter sp.]|nr:RagB/SusD family nutrient uptake outer membrane protein [Phnomibacter sp.]
MKTKLFAISLVMLGLSLASCEKFLEPETPSAFTDDYIFSTASDASKAVNSVYAMFNQDAFTSRVSNSWANNTDVEVGGVAGAPDGGRRDIWSFQSTEGFADLGTVWNNAYKAINRANECIEGIKKSALAETPEMQQLLGEAYTLRAYWYYLLVNHWGDVPVKFTPTVAGDEFYLPKVPRMEILTQVIKDLQEIEPKMMWVNEIQFGNERIGREFVLGFIARLSLCRGGYYLQPDMTMKREADYLEYYKIANAACKKLASLKPRTLAPDFGKMFREFCQYIKNDEVLWEVAFSPGFGDVGWASGITVVAGNHAFGSTTITTNFPLTYYHSFDTTDLRLEPTCSRISYDANLVQVPVNFNAMTCGKWSRTYMADKARGAASAKGTGINWPIMRYSDILLMLAETENEIAGGPTADAKDALAKVRRRAFAPAIWSSKVDDYINTVSAGKEAFFNAIVNERAWEFGGECLRKADLIRWNLYAKKVTETQAGLTLMADNAVAGVGPTPDYLYYKKNSDGSNTWLNKYGKAPVAPPVVDVPAKGDNPDGWLRLRWGLGISADRTTNAANGGGYIGWQYRGYTDPTGVTPLRYILPIHTGVISTSNGSLKNDGYGF